MRQAQEEKHQSSNAGTEPAAALMCRIDGGYGIVSKPKAVV
jgi:hypothetical protein